MAMLNDMAARAWPGQEGDGGPGAIDASGATSDDGLSRAIADTIIAIEQDLDVSSLKYKGFHAWPLIRNEIYMAHRSKPAEFWYRGEAGERAEDHRRSLSSASPRLSRGAELRRLVASIRNGSPAAGARGVDVLFFCRTHEHVRQPDGSYYNRWVDPYFDAIRQRYLCFKVELANSESESHRNRTIDTAVLPMNHPGEERLAASAERIAGFDQVRANVDRYVKGYRVDEAFFARKLEAADFYSQYFRIVLEKIKPRLVSIICYYYEIGYGLMKACHDLGIPTLDIQHGGNADQHACYFFRTKAPPGGYEIVPDVFWVWSDYFKRKVEALLPPEVDHHRCVVGGNLDLARDAEMDAAGGHPWLRDYVSAMGKWRKNILVAPSKLLDRDNTIDVVMDAIGRAPKDWGWHIRAHPADHSPEEIRSWEALLVEKGCDNVVVTAAQDLPLGVLLRQSDHLVTSWSGICFDALSFGVATSFTSETAWMWSPDGLREGYFGLARDGGALLSNIETMAKGAIDSGDAAPLLDRSAALDAFECLLSA